MEYRYMKQEWEEGQETFYFELDTEGIVTRQIVEQPNKLLVSNRPQFLLSETPIEFLPDYQIDRNEFECMWDLANEPYMLDWLVIKYSLMIDMVVEGLIEVIYPQGIIVNLGDGRYGICDYEECKRASGSHNIHAGNRIRGKLSGFDDTNLWLKMERSEVISL